VRVVVHWAQGSGRHFIQQQQAVHILLATHAPAHTEHIHP
jgi:hypothetical protein